MERRLELSHLSHAFLKDREDLVPELGKRQLWDMLLPERRSKEALSIALLRGGSRSKGR